MKFYLDENKSKRSVNEEKRVNVELLSSAHRLPTSSLKKTLDAYQEYFSEKDASDKHRLLFTINPICSNILFNANTEVIYKEGSPDCLFCSKDKSKNTGFITVPDIGEYMRYKNLSQTQFDRLAAIQDTAYSHPNIGNVTYHCGIDIFNNHTLRRKEFSPIAKIASGVRGFYKTEFNTIRDYVRDINGQIVTESNIRIKPDGKAINNTPMLHVYTLDNCRTFQKSISDNLAESDGWVGFINPISINVKNYSNYTINKCINNASGGEMIDMYPDRTLYSFVPKTNVYRNRLEKNWDYCLTYPYKNYTNNDVVEKNGINGIRCDVLSSLRGTVFDKETWVNDTTINGEDGVEIYLRTDIRNTFSIGTMINLTVIDTRSSSSRETTSPIMIQGVGKNNEDKEHIFSIKVEDLFSVVAGFGGSYLSNGMLDSRYEVRVRRNDGGNDCKYYFRLFRRLPNFNGSEVYYDTRDVIEEKDVNKYCETDFNSSINKLAFSENIFSDKVCQLIFNDDINVGGLRDNLGRQLSEIYLTIVKRNAGYEKWYVNGQYGDESVEFSHCFGRVTSGLDLGTGSTKFNVHKLHNIAAGTNLPYTLPTAETPLEDNITISGKTMSSANGIFFGDIVEFSITKMEERVLEDVYHRFNTAQREISCSEFGKITYDEITHDDYDIDGNFTVREIDYGGDRNVALMPEGYYYKPHYRVAIKQFDSLVKQGCDIKMGFSELTKLTSNTFSGITAVPYYLNIGDKIDIYNVTSNTKTVGIITNVTGSLFNEITFKADIAATEDIKKLFIYKRNPEKPSYAYELNDGTGRYLWREAMSSKDMIEGDELYNSIFTNGAHYYHKQINFYLKRQDPFGEYGLNITGTLDYVTGAASGQFKDISVAEYVNENEGTIC